MQSSEQSGMSTCNLSLEKCRLLHPYKIEVWHDGSAREKMNKSLVAIIIDDELEVVDSSEPKSNRVEFDAVRIALQMLDAKGVAKARFLGDSERLVAALSEGNLVNTDLIRLRASIRALQAGKDICWHHISREKNLAGQALERIVQKDARQRRASASGLPGLNDTSITSVS